jgi:hypothetical protein
VIVTLKVLPCSSQALLTSVTVTLDAASRVRSQSGVLPQLRLAGGATVTSLVVVALAPSSSVTVRLTVK